MAINMNEININVHRKVLDELNIAQKWINMTFKEAYLPLYAKYYKEELKKLDITQEYLGEYDIFISDIVEFLKSYNLKNAQEIYMFLTLLINSGIFTIAKKTPIQLDENASEAFNLVPDLFGSKITTGKVMCSHLSAFYTDCFLKYGYPAANIPVKEYSNIFKKYWHAVNGVIENEKIIMFDATCSLSDPKMVFTSFLEKQGQLLKNYYLFFNTPFYDCYMKTNFKKSFFFNRQELADEFKILPIKSFDIQELLELEIFLTKEFINAKEDVKSFYHQEAGQIRKIVKLYQEFK